MSLIKVLKTITNHPLNRDDKIKAIIRFIKWQIACRFGRGDRVVEWINGSKFFARRGETGLTGNIYSGLAEFEDMAFLLHYLRKGDLFVDVGANSGAYTILACSSVGARGYAFEPIPATFARLVANVRLNNLEERAKCFNIGVGKGEGRLTFTGELDTVNHVLAHGEISANKIDVKISPLDSILNGDCPLLMKIDVEGFEFPVLEGGRETLKNPALNSVIIELNGSGSKYGFNENGIVELMEAGGFRSFSYDPFGRKLIDLHGKTHNTGNTIFIRDQAMVQKRLAEAPILSVYGKRF